MSVEPYRLPFTVLIDSNESQPWTFQNINGDADVDYRPLAVPTRWQSLGRYPHGLGDYSIEGFTERIAVERKSIDDLWGTILGWETEHDKKKSNVGRRARFEKELENLSKIDVGLVVVEATLGEVLNTVPEWGVKPAFDNRKTLSRSIIAYQQDYRAQWIFCDSRRMAEVITLRHLQRFFRKHKEELATI